LELGQYYSVSLVTDVVQVQKDFYVDEDPKIASIFPAADEEASEYSRITILFNRPMVPLTTLSILEAGDIPVEIYPNTAGKFKWITTRNLQFIPDVRLNRSTNYTVKVKSGFQSVDGLAVDGMVHSFFTRPLRYENFANKSKLYTTPIRFSFNQPVDIERTGQAITVKDASGNPIDTIFSYGVRSIYDKKKKKTEERLDKSIVEVYNARDQHGRKKFWDFDTSYSFDIARAYPLEGDISLDERKSGRISVTNIISSINADSDRSSHASPSLFDPEGDLVVNFHEDIDIRASKISSAHIKNIEYGEKCEDSENYYNRTCSKVEDKQKLIISFHSHNLSPGNRFILLFEKIVNTSGLILNAEAIEEEIAVYPQFRVTDSQPASNSKNADLKELILCSNSPIKRPDNENLDDLISSNIDVGLQSWTNAQYNRNSGGPCNSSEYATTIMYGLAPETQYDLQINLQDDFGQSAISRLTFNSGKLDTISRAFYHLQNKYSVTSPDKLKLTYAVNNLEYINLDFCEVSAISMMNTITNYSRKQVPPRTFQCDRRESKRIDLPDRYWTRNHFQVDLEDLVTSSTGHYILTFSHPEYKRINRKWDQDIRKYIETEGELVYEHTFVTVTNLAVQEKKVVFESDGTAYSDFTIDALDKGKAYNLYWVTRIGTLEPVPAATVDLRSESGKRLGIFTTGGDGIAVTNIYPGVNSAIISSVGDSALISSSNDGFRYVTDAYAMEKTFIYTDRPIYRPGETVHIKGLHRVGLDSNYAVINADPAEVIITSSKYEEVQKEDAPISEYGTFTTEYLIDREAPLGNYTIRSGYGGYASFDVQEFVPAAFEVSTKTDKDEYIAGDEAEIEVSANYFFGVPVESGDVEYTITSQDYYFDKYKGKYFRFGLDWYYGYGDSDYGDRYLQRGSTALKSDGTATIKQELDLNKLFEGNSPERSKIFNFNITVKSSTGEAITTQKSFIVHRGEYYLGVNLDKRYTGKGEPFKANVKTVNTEGAGHSVSGIKMEISKITWESFKRQEGYGDFYYRGEEKKEIVQTHKIRTNANGDAEKNLSMSDEGEYEIALSATDRKGNVITTAQRFYVHGGETVSIRPTNDFQLELETENKLLDVGEQVTIIIKSPYKRAKALITLERGKIFSHEIIDINSNLAAYNFTVKDEFIPNVSASVMLLSPDPQIKYGRLDYKVNIKNRELDIDITSNKNNYLPGESVTLDIVVKDENGNPARTELSVAVADLSVLALKGNPKKNPVLFFYSGSPISVSTASNIRNILIEKIISEDGTKGGGGGAPDDDLAKKQRGTFRSTALWEGAVETDSAGRASITFTLPDNLTAWQAESVGITKDTKLGVGYDEFKTRKDVMVVPHKPRFIVPGDKFSIGAQIFNQTSETQRLKVSFMSDTLVSHEATSVRLKAGETKTVYFETQAPSNILDGEHRFIVSAKNSDYEDSVENVISITRNDTYESVATANYTSKNQSREFYYLPDQIIKDKGGLEVKSSATLAVYLSDALNYLVDYPYGCSEQIASKLGSIAIVKRGLSLENIGDSFELDLVEFEGNKYTPDEVVKIGLARIYSNQNSDGGFAYYGGMKSNFYLSLHMINTLVELRDAGYEIDEERLKNASKYLEKNFLSTSRFKDDKDLLILTAYTLGQANQNSTSELANRVVGLAGDSKYINETSSSQSLAYMAMILSGLNQPVLADQVYAQLENRLVTDARGASLSTQGRKVVWQFYETNIKNTALFVKAFAVDERDFAVMDKVLRWLLRSRAKDGAWGSTNNTLAVVDAFTEFLLWKRENLSLFELDLFADDTKLSTTQFGPENILETVSEFIPIESLQQNTLGTLRFEKNNKNNEQNSFYYDMLLKYFLPIDTVPPRDEGFSITRSFYALDDTENATRITETKQGDVLRGHITITVPRNSNFVALEDFIPAGMELINLDLATADKSLQEYLPDRDPYRYDDYGGFGSAGGRVNFSSLGYLDNNFPILGPFAAIFGGFSGVESPGYKELDDEYYGNRITVNRRLYPSASELHDDRVFLFSEQLRPGVYEYDYFVRALVPGSYHHLPAVVSEMYFPEQFGRTSGNFFTITKD
jgi:uncharacterized protein YfaS (alpha-2-macroglobulin family)